MDFNYLLRKYKGQKVKVGVIGATRGYGYTIIDQLRKSPLCALRFISSRHSEECRSVLLELGYDEKRIKVCSNRDEVKESGSGDHLIISDYSFMTDSGVDVVIECTGNTQVGADATTIALENGIDVCMVSKETDSICGPYFNALAEKNGRSYMLAEGDQPRNLVDLHSWALVNGMEVIAAGKSSEYDIIYDRDSGDVKYFDNPVVNIPEILKEVPYKGVETLERRKALLSSMLYPISADLCEMNLVSNATGLKPAAATMNYPVARISELADIFIPKEDGGILDSTGVVDVFYNFRASDEASFAGGEFVVVKVHNPKVFSLLEEKGHVVSRNGNYVCLYHPYHILGVQTPSSIVLQHFLRVGGNPDCRQHSIMVGEAERDFRKGDSFAVSGHHHEIQGVSPRLMERDKVSKKALPFYVLNGAVAKEDIRKGEILSEDKIEISKGAVVPYEIYCKGLKLD